MILLTFLSSLSAHSAQDVWVHTISPFAIQFTETFGIRWYGLAYLAGFVLGALIIQWLAKRSRDIMPQSLVWDLVTYCVVGTIIGGRLGYAIFYQQSLLTEFSASFPFWGVLKVWEGGLASHGGIAGVFIAFVLFARKHKLNWRHLGDLVILGGSLGIFFGRVANFINGELFGREVSGSIAWAVKFPSEVFLWFQKDIQHSNLNESPRQLEAITPVIEKMSISSDTWLTWVQSLSTSGSARYSVYNTLQNLITQIQAGNAELTNALATYLTARHPSQIYQALLEGLLLFFICFWLWRKPRIPGIIGSWWIILYASMRIVGENFRMPDAHIGFDLLGLTRGQWISTAMLALGVFLLILFIRQGGKKIGGWAKSS